MPTNFSTLQSNINLRSNTDLSSPPLSAFFHHTVSALQTQMKQDRCHPSSFRYWTVIPASDSLSGFSLPISLALSLLSLLVRSHSFWSWTSHHCHPWFCQSVCLPRQKNFIYLFIFLAIYSDFFASSNSVQVVMTWSLTTHRTRSTKHVQICSINFWKMNTIFCCYLPPGIFISGFILVSLRAGNFQTILFFPK